MRTDMIYRRKITFIELLEKNYNCDGGCVN